MQLPKNNHPAPSALPLLRRRGVITKKQPPHAFGISPPSQEGISFYVNFTALARNHKTYQ